MGGAAAVGVCEVGKIVSDCAVLERTTLGAEVFAQVVSVGDVEAKLKAMFAVGPRDGVSVLGAAFVRESGTGEECGDAHVKAIEDENVRWQPQRICIAGEMGGSNEIGLLIGGGGLGEPQIKVTPILEARLGPESLGGGKGRRLAIPVAAS